jgi:hypothetical protein
MKSEDPQLQIGATILDASCLASEGALAGAFSYVVR